MAWVDQTYGYGSTLTAAKMTQLQANAVYVGNFKVMAIMRDTSLATGNVAYTGAGVLPKKITLLAAGQYASEGTHVGSTARCYVTYGGIELSALGRIYNSTVTYYNTITLSSFDADGVTLTYTKTGSPTGTVDLFMILEG